MSCDLVSYSFVKNPCLESFNLISIAYATSVVFISKDALIAENALELLVTCLQLRANLLNVFYYLPDVNEFIVDVLTGSPSAPVSHLFH